MDIGIGKFLEMFEERFGRFPTSILLLIIGLAVATFCVKIIWLEGAIPFADLVFGLLIGEEWAQEVYISLLIFATLINIGIAYIILRYMLGLGGLERKAQETLMQAEQEVNRAKELLVEVGQAVENAKNQEQDGQ